MNTEWKSSGHTSALVVCDSVKVFQKELRNHSSKGNKDKSTLLTTQLCNLQCINYTVVLLMLYNYNFSNDNDCAVSVLHN